MKTTNPMRASASVKAMPKNIVVLATPADSGTDGGQAVAKTGADGAQARFTVTGQLGKDGGYQCKQGKCLLVLGV